ncbi:WD40-repeat-containing domain protein [Dichotomocladium elegans]|nr:WD40-repeat-containing domain protein [Dichotomocladium elegans]
MIKRKRTPDNSATSHNLDQGGASSSSTSWDSSAGKRPRLTQALDIQGHQHQHQHQILSDGSPAQTILPIDDPRLFKDTTEPDNWNLVKYNYMRKVHNRHLYGRILHTPKQHILKTLTCSEDDEYHFCFSSNSRSCVPFSCTYSNHAYGGHLMAVGDEAKRITLVRTDKGNSVDNQSYHNYFSAHNDAVLSLKFSNDDHLLTSGSGDGLVRIWDVDTKVCVATMKGHSNSLRSVDFHPSNQNLLVSAAKDGSFLLWDIRTRQIGVLPECDENWSGAPLYAPIKVTKDAHQRVTKKSKGKENYPIASRLKPDHSVTRALFLPTKEDVVITSGSSDGTIKMWDCRAGRDSKPLSEYHYDGPSTRVRGFSDLQIDHSGTRLFGLNMDGSISMHYLTNISRVATRYTAPDYKTLTFFSKIAISYDDSFIAAGSANRSLYIWEIDRPKVPALKLGGPQQDVTAVAWSKNRHEVSGCSDDGCVRVWRR